MRSERLTEWEYEEIRKATALREAAPALLAGLKSAIESLKTVSVLLSVESKSGYIESLEAIVAKAEGREA